MTPQTLVTALRQSVFPLRGAPSDYEPLLALVGEARFVLLGEASHGTEEFYRARASITRMLIEQYGFQAVVVEADWPDAYRVNRYIRGESEEESAQDALADFKRFPLWMWRNRAVLDFVTWLRAHNEGCVAQTRVGFYGMDLYSLHRSIEAVLGYLDRVDSEGAARARYRYSCFDHFGENSQAYGYAANFGLSPSCEREVLAQLTELQRRAGEPGPGGVAEDEAFFAEQNARLVKNAEAYYRSMFEGRVNSWNLRDSHMTETLAALDSYLSRQTGQPARLVVWAHNSHLGDARATEMGTQGEWNVGQLMRERYGMDAVRLIGFSTYTGRVTAATNWDEPAQLKQVRPALPDSYEALFHEVGGDFLLSLHGEYPSLVGLRAPRLERAIGIIYRPESERLSHYFHARLPEQFDAILHFDQTEAVEPLDPVSSWERGKVPESYPTGL